MLLTDPQDIEKAIKKMLSKMPSKTVEKFARDFGVPIQSSTDKKDILKDNKFEWEINGSLF